MTSLLPFSKILSALKLNMPARTITSAEAIDSAILSLHSVISDPAETPEAVRVAKRLLLRLLDNPRTAEYAAGAGIPAASLIRAALNPDSMRRRLSAPRIAVARTPSSRKGGATSSAGSSRLTRSDVRRGGVRASSESEEPSRAVVARRVKAPVYVTRRG